MNKDIHFVCESVQLVVLSESFAVAQIARLLAVDVTGGDAEEIPGRATSDVTGCTGEVAQREQGRRRVLRGRRGTILSLQNVDDDDVDNTTTTMMMMN